MRSHCELYKDVTEGLMLRHFDSHFLLCKTTHFSERCDVLVFCPYRKWSLLNLVRFTSEQVIDLTDNCLMHRANAPVGRE